MLSTFCPALRIRTSGPAPSMALSKLGPISVERICSKAVLTAALNPSARLPSVETSCACPFTLKRIFEHQINRRNDRLISVIEKMREAG